ncbi:MAG: hypothetical protein JRI68_04365 [Deltaproteobacteria bacterium]|nr:hypothetical protein [Deltaproteobacteria bacterium]
MKESDVRAAVAGLCGKLDGIVSRGGKRVSPLAAVPLVLAASWTLSACNTATPEYMAPCEGDCDPSSSTSGQGGLGGAGGSGGLGGGAGQGGDAPGGGGSGGT